MEEQQQHLTVPERRVSLVFTPPMDFQDFELVGGEMETEATGVKEIQRLPTAEEVVAALSSSLLTLDNATEVNAETDLSRECVLSVNTNQPKNLVKADLISDLTELVSTDSFKDPVTKIEEKSVVADLVKGADDLAEPITSAETHIAIASKLVESAAEVSFASPVSLEAVSLAIAEKVDSDISASVESATEVQRHLTPKVLESDLLSSVKVKSDKVVSPLDQVQDGKVLETRETVATAPEDAAGLVISVLNLEIAQSEVSAFKVETEIIPCAEIPDTIVLKVAETADTLSAEIPSAETSLTATEGIIPQVEVPAVKAEVIVTALEVAAEVASVFKERTVEAEVANATEKISNAPVETEVTLDLKSGASEECLELPAENGIVKAAVLGTVETAVTAVIEAATEVSSDITSEVGTSPIAEVSMAEAEKVIASPAEAPKAIEIAVTALVEVVTEYSSVEESIALLKKASVVETAAVKAPPVEIPDSIFPMREDTIATNPEVAQVADVEETGATASVKAATEVSLDKTLQIVEVSTHSPAKGSVVDAEVPETAQKISSAPIEAATDDSIIITSETAENCLAPPAKVAILEAETVVARTAEVPYTVEKAAPIAVEATTEVSLGITLGIAEGCTSSSAEIALGDAETVIALPVEVPEPEVTVQIDPVEAPTKVSLDIPLATVGVSASASSTKVAVVEIETEIGPKVAISNTVFPVTVETVVSTPIVAPSAKVVETEVTVATTSAEAKTEFSSDETLRTVAVGPFPPAEVSVAEVELVIARPTEVSEGVQTILTPRVEAATEVYSDITLEPIEMVIFPPLEISMDEAETFIAPLTKVTETIDTAATVQLEVATEDSSTITLRIVDEGIAPLKDDLLIEAETVISVISSPIEIPVSVVPDAIETIANTPVEACLAEVVGSEVKVKTISLEADTELYSDKTLGIFEVSTSPSAEMSVAKAETGAVASVDPETASTAPLEATTKVTSDITLRTIEMDSAPLAEVAVVETEPVIAPSVKFPYTAVPDIVENVAADQVQVSLAISFGTVKEGPVSSAEAVEVETVIVLPAKVLETLETAAAGPVEAAIEHSLTINSRIAKEYPPLPADVAVVETETVIVPTAKDPNTVETALIVSVEAVKENSSVINSETAEVSTVPLVEIAVVEAERVVAVPPEIQDNIVLDTLETTAPVKATTADLETAKYNVDSSVKVSAVENETIMVPPAEVSFNSVFGIEAEVVTTSEEAVTDLSLASNLARADEDSAPPEKLLPIEAKTVIAPPVDIAHLVFSETAAIVPAATEYSSDITLGTVQLGEGPSAEVVVVEAEIVIANPAQVADTAETAVTPPVEVATVDSFVITLRTSEERIAPLKEVSVIETFEISDTVVPDSLQIVTNTLVDGAMEASLAITSETADESPSPSEEILTVETETVIASSAEVTDTLETAVTAPAEVSSNITSGIDVGGTELPATNSVIEAQTVIVSSAEDPKRVETVATGLVEAAIEISLANISGSAEENTTLDNTVDNTAETVIASPVEAAAENSTVLALETTEAQYAAMKAETSIGSLAAVTVTAISSTSETAIIPEEKIEAVEVSMALVIESSESITTASIDTAKESFFHAASVTVEEFPALRAEVPVIEAEIFIVPPVEVLVDVVLNSAEKFSAASITDPILIAEKVDTALTKTTVAFDTVSETLLATCKTSPKLTDIQTIELPVSAAPLKDETKIMSAVAVTAEVSAPNLDNISNESASVLPSSGFSITLETPLPVVASVLQMIAERIKDQKRRNQEVIDRLVEIERILGVSVN